MLTAAEVEHFRENGYVIPPFRLSDSTVEGLKAQHARLLDRHPEFHDYCGALLVHDLGFLETARDPGILDMVEQLIGPDIALWNMSLFAKPAREGTRTPWHQDGRYWPMRPLATCTVWIALDDATPENGCMRFMPGSHRRRQLASHHTSDAPDVALRLELDAEHVDEAAAIDVVLEAGQVSLHDVFLMHASGANRSARPRRGMTLRYMPTTSIYRRDLPETKAVDEQRTLFLMRGTDRSGQNDFRIRPPGP